MKNILTIILLFILPTTSYSKDVIIDGVAYNLNDNNQKATVISKEVPYKGDVVIPGKIAYGGIEYSVTGIGEYAFGGCSELSSISIPESVDTIYRDAFMDCSNITSVIIPNNVVEIGIGAFANCVNLTSVELSSRINKLSNGLFDGCYKLSNIVIPSNIISIEPCAFRGCYSLTSLYLPKGLKTLKADCFSECNNLSEINISETVDSIFYSAFSYCANIERIIVEEGNIKYDSRNNCNAIIETSSNRLILGCKTSVLPMELETIGEGAFIGREIDTIILPDNIKKIEGHAFYNCEMLSSIKLPSALQTIEYAAFMGCKKLVGINLPEAISSICNSVFEGCSNLTSIIIPSSLDEIQAETFKNCTSLESVYIGNKVRKIGNSAFENCSDLANVYCYATEPPSCKKDAFLNSYYTSATLYVPENSLDLYKNARVWKNFNSIVSLETGINSIDNTNNSLYYYSLDGKRFLSQPLKKGIYINGRRKLILK